MYYLEIFRNPQISIYSVFESHYSNVIQYIEEDVRTSDKLIFVGLKRLHSRQI